MAQDSVIHSLIFGFGFRARHGKDTVAKAILDARGTPVFHGKMYEGAVEENMGRGTGTIDRPAYDIRSYSFAKELKDEVNAVFEAYKRARPSVSDKETWEYMFYHLRDSGVFIDPVDETTLRIPDWVVMEPDPDMNDPLCPYGKYRSLLQWWGSEYRRNNFGDNYWVERAAARVAEERPEIALFTDMRFPNEMAFVKQYGPAVKVFNPRVPTLNAHISEEALAHVPDSEWDAILINDGTLEEIQAKAVAVFDRLMNQQQ